MCQIECQVGITQRNWCLFCSICHPILLRISPNFGSWGQWLWQGHPHQPEQKKPCLLPAIWTAWVSSKMRHAEKNPKILKYGTSRLVKMALIFKQSIMSADDIDMGVSQIVKAWNTLPKIIYAFRCRLKTYWQNRSFFRPKLNIWPVSTFLAVQLLVDTWSLLELPWTMGSQLLPPWQSVARRCGPEILPPFVADVAVSVVCSFCSSSDNSK